MYMYKLYEVEFLLYKNCVWEREGGGDWRTSGCFLDTVIFFC
jgi:hypothetical protein